MPRDFSDLPPQVRQIIGAFPDHAVPYVISADISGSYVSLHNRNGTVGQMMAEIRSALPVGTQVEDHGTGSGPDYEVTFYVGIEKEGLREDLDEALDHIADVLRTSLEGYVGAAVHDMLPLEDELFTLSYRPLDAEVGEVFYTVEDFPLPAATSQEGQDQESPEERSQRVAQELSSMSPAERSRVFAQMAEQDARADVGSGEPEIQSSSSSSESEDRSYDWGVDSAATTEENPPTSAAQGSREMAAAADARRGSRRRRRG